MRTTDEQKLSPIDQRICDFIYNHPDIVAKLLDRHGCYVATPLTLTSIFAATMDAIYVNTSLRFASDLDIAMASGGYSNFEPITMGVSAVLSIASSILGSQQAKKAREMQWKIESAKLSQTRLLQEESIRTGAETERTKILLQTLQQYQSDLQGQSTERIKNAGIYAGILATIVGGLWGLSMMLSSNNK